MKRHLKVIALVATLLVAGGIVMTASVNAIDRGTIRKFAENNIYFYDPDGINNTCSAAATKSTTLAGITPERQSGSSLENAKMVLNRLMKAGYSAVAAAAIAGNLDWEGGFYPCKVENGGYDESGHKYTSGASCDYIDSAIDSYKGKNDYILTLKKGSGSGIAGVGIVQWTSEERKKGLIDAANAGGVRVTDLNTQVDFLVKELQSWNSKSHPSTISSLNELAKGADGLILATWRIYRYYETPATSFKWKGGSGDFNGDENDKEPSNPLELNSVDHAGAYNEFYGHRLPSALFYLNLLESSGSVSLTPEKDRGQVPESEIVIVATGDFSESLKSALTEKLPNVTITDKVADAKKYTIYVSEITDEAVKDKVEEIAGEVDAKNNIFFMTTQTAVANAAKEVAQSKDNVKVVGYSPGTEVQAVETLMEGIKSIENAKSRSINPCVGGTLNGVTFKEIEGTLYAFPDANATKANYNISGLTHFRALDQYNFKTGWGGAHHDYPAVDIGINMGNGSTEGATVVAFVDGTITSYSTYTDSQKHCASVTFKGIDGATYWIGHMNYEPDKYGKLQGNKISAGTPIGTVGPASCAAYESSSTPHTHIDERHCNDPSKGAIRPNHLCYYDADPRPNGTKGWKNYYSTHIVDVMAQLYWELPQE